RRLDQPEATELAATDGAYSPFFSPDGKWVAFFASGKLKKIPIAGGAPIELCNVGNNPRGGSWGEDGSIIAALSNTGGLSRISSDGGMPTSLTELAKGESTHRWPQILPGGKGVLFTVHSSALAGFDEAAIEVMSLKDHSRKTLLKGGAFGRYVPSGHLTYISRGTLYAQLFDPDRLEVRGERTSVLEQVAYSTQNGSAQLAFSEAGTFLYRSGGASAGLF